MTYNVQLIIEFMRLLCVPDYVGKRVLGGVCVCGGGGGGGGGGPLPATYLLKLSGSETWGYVADTLLGTCRFISFTKY